MAQRILVILSFIALIVVTIVGGVYWNEKQEQVVNSAEAGVNGHGSKSGGTVKKSDARRTEIESMTANLPKGVQKAFLAAYDDGKKLEIAFVGTSALGKGAGGWSDMVEKQLETAYGTSFVDVVTYQYDGGSSGFLTSSLAEEIASASYDIVFLEGFTLEDNGEISIDQSLANVGAIVDLLVSGNPDVQIILQPPHPIYAAVNYPRQVEQLKAFAEERGLPYFDHWTNWPDYTSDEILQYLTDDNMPSGTGHQLWAEAIMNYFVAK